MRIANRIPLLFAWCLLALCSPTPAEEAKREQVIVLGRQGKALDWLERLGDVPATVVSYDSLRVAEVVPRTGEFYEIDPDVVAAAYSYFFFVRGKEAEFVVGSTLNLAKLVRELAVVEEIKERNKGVEMAQGLGEGLKSIGTGLASLVTHPGQSLKSVGARIRQTGRSLERMVGAAEDVGRDESGENRSHLGEGPAGAIRRKLAYELGVDVYTSNPVLQRHLVELSQLQTLGGLATWAIPYNIGLLAYMNLIGGEEKAELLIRDFDPYELRRNVGLELERQFGIEREDEAGPLHRLLYNPNFTPRSIAYIGLDFEYLRQAGNLPAVLDKLSRADTPEEADMLALELRLYSFFHRRIQPLVEFLSMQTIFAGVGANGVLYIMFFGDTLRPWALNAEIFDRLVTDALALRMRGMEIWTLGDVDPGMVQRAAGRGVVVRQNILRDPQFFPAPEQMERR